MYLKTEFMPAETTDRPESVRSTTTDSIETGNIVNDGEMPSTSGYIANVCITPESVRPFKKAEQRKNKCVRRKGSTRILTDTPEKEKIRALQKRKTVRYLHFYDVTNVLF